MFTPLRWERKRWNSSLAVSLGVHCVVLVIWLWPEAPIFVRPNSVARGEWGKETTIYLGQLERPRTKPVIPLEQALAYVPAPKQIVPQRHTAKSKPRNEKKLRTADEPKEVAKAGTPFGSSLNGPDEGADVRPALPTVFPEPPVNRWEIPDGVRGDVIVEVTIDKQGNVIETRLLQGIGHSAIEEKVVATVRNWRFRPATRDGAPIPSKQDVYFHYPS